MRKYRGTPPERIGKRGRPRRVDKHQARGSQRPKAHILTKKHG